jgi:hypothetical protein
MELDSAAAADEEYARRLQAKMDAAEVSKAHRGCVLTPAVCMCVDVCVISRACVLVMGQYLGVLFDRIGVRSVRVSSQAHDTVDGLICLDAPLRCAVTAIMICHTTRIAAE